MTFLFKRNTIYLGLGSITAISSAYLSSSFWFNLPLFNYLISEDKKKTKEDVAYIYLQNNNSQHDNDSSYELPFERSNHFTEPNRHWHLLRLAHSENEKIKHSAIKELAIDKFSDYQFHEIAQVCDFHTSISLAKIPNVNTKLYKPRIKSRFINLNDKNSSPFNFDEVLTVLLQECLKYDNCSECTKYFANLALKLLTEENLEDLLEAQQHEFYQIRKNNKNQIYWIVLQAILQLSLSGEQQCEKLVKNGLFLILNVYMEKFSDRQTKSCILQILLNLSMYKSIHEHFWISGWLGTLVQWLNSNDIEFCFSSSKILLNLNSNETCLSGDSLYILHPLYNETDESEFDVIFVHGLLGGVFRTWRQCDSEKNSPNYTKCWPKSWLANDIENVRILGIDYPTYLSDWNIECPSDKFTLKDRSTQVINILTKEKVGQKPILWVVHSMGGLLVKQILLDSYQSDNQILKRIANQTKGILFYAVPHKGSDMAVWSPRIQRIILPSTEVLELRKDSSFLHDLHEKFLEVVQDIDIKCLSFGETLKSKVGYKSIKWNALLVPSESADPGIGKFILLPVDHYNICKPVDKQSPAYSLALNFIKQIIQTQESFKAKRQDELSAVLTSLIY